MNNKHIHDYLDGGLGAGAERDLFAAMGESDELRQEFADQQKLHGIIKKDMAAAVTPPELTAAVFAELGFTLPGAVPPVAPPAASFAGKVLAWLGGTTGYVLTGIGAAAITVWLLMPKFEETTNKSSVSLPKVASSSAGEAQSTGTNLANKSKTSSFTKGDAVLSGVNERVKSGESTGKNLANRSNSTKNYDLGMATANPPLHSADITESSPEERTAITEAAYKSYPMRALSRDTTAGLLDIRQPETAMQSSGSKWTFHIRTVQHISSNFNDVIFIFKPYFSAGVLYSLTPYHALGVEAGYESFHAAGEITDNTTPQWQDIWWGGISYKASFPQLSPTKYVTPDLRISMGMTTTGGTPTPGALLRATGGLTLAPGNGTYYSVGLESAWLLLPGNKNFSAAQRFGFVLGAAIEL